MSTRGEGPAVTDQQVYLFFGGRKYHFEGGWPGTSWCSVSVGLDLSAAADPAQVAIDERCQRDGCRQKWAAVR